MNKEDLLKLAKTPMPFGKYAGRMIIDLPEPYLLWFSNKGFPEDRLGRLMQLALEVKINGLEYTIDKFGSTGSVTEGVPKGRRVGAISSLCVSIVVSCRKPAPVDHAKGQSTLNGKDSTELPSTQYLAQDSRLILHEGNFPEEVGHETVADIEGGTPVVQPNVQGIIEISPKRLSDQASRVFSSTKEVGPMVQSLSKGIGSLKGQSLAEAFAELSIHTVVVGGDPILSQVQTVK